MFDQNLSLKRSTKVSKKTLGWIFDTRMKQIASLVGGFFAAFKRRY